MARWSLEGYGPIAPSIFIPIVEKNNMMIAFGNMIVRQALNQYHLLEEKYKKSVTLSINISPTHLLWPDFYEFVLSEITSRNVKPECIILEITEEVMIDGLIIVNQILKKLRSCGIKISLDDFGTGYSSLSYLSELELDELKIDRSFIMRIDSEEKVKSLIGAIIKLKESHDFNIVAEGVETKAQCDLISSLGCNTIQGYYFSKPSPVNKGDL